MTFSKEVYYMRKSDQQLVLYILGFLAFVFLIWLLASIIQYLTDHRFVYGLIIGVLVGLAAGYFFRWWQHRN